MADQVSVFKCFVCFVRLPYDNCLSPCQQEDKIYVQHRLLENSSLVWNLLSHKQGWCYIAGYDELFFHSSVVVLFGITIQDLARTVSLTIK